MSEPKHTMKEWDNIREREKVRKNNEYFSQLKKKDRRLTKEQYEFRLNIRYTAIILAIILFVVGLGFMIAGIPTNPNLVGIGLAMAIIGAVMGMIVTSE